MSLDADPLWERARAIIARYGDQSPAFVARQIDSHDLQNKREGAMTWRAIAWRVAELRRRAQSEAWSRR
ncbi:MAG: hypothetical protein LC634_08660 [Sphingomonadales bacterium]|nr:hypothetical protein [Sphingomonadales bacterium]